MNDGPLNDRPINAAADIDEDPLATLDGLGRERTDPIWLLDLVVGGHVYRFASEACVPEDRDGHAFPYAEGLADPGATLGEVAGYGDASIGVSVQSDVPWAELVANGHALDRCVAELRLWWPGTELERARVVLRGRTFEPELGARHEPLAVSIVRDPSDQSRTIPPAQAVVDIDTFPGTWSWAYGMTIPLIIGAPGADDVFVRAVVPVPPVDVDLSGIDLDGILTVTLAWIGDRDATDVTVRVVGGDAELESAETVSEVTDELGATFVATSLDVDSNEQGERPAFFIGFGTPSGMRWRGQVLRGAGDVVAWILTEHYAGPVDTGRLEAARARLNQYKVDSWVNEPVSAWDWLQAEILPWLPLELREGRDGVYPAVLRWDLRRRDAVAHLEVGRNVDRTTPLAFIGDIANQVVVEYRPADDRFLERRFHTSTWTADAPLDPRAAASLYVDRRRLGSALASESQRRYGVRERRVELAHTWDTATADLVASDILARDALPRRAVSFEGSPWLLDLEIGQCVTVTDEDLHLDAELAILVDHGPVAGGGAAVDLVLLDRYHQRPT